MAGGDDGETAPAAGKSGSEDGTVRDGFLSYPAEWHSFAWGLYAGMKDWKPGPGGLPDDPDVRAEPHYYKGGFVIGSVLQIAGMALFAAGVAGVL